MPQIQFYLWIGQADGCYLSIIFGNRRWECQYVSKDWDYINAMQVRIKEFWSCVADNRRPFEDERANVSIDNIKVDGMVRRDASSDNEFMYQVQDYIQQEGNEREVYCDSLIIKRDKRGSLRFTVLNNEEN